MEQALFRRRQKAFSRQKVPSDSLRVAVQERSPGAEWLAKVVPRGGGFSRQKLVVCRFAQELIVGGDDRKLLPL
jgi:hypothetical protein